MYQKSVNRRKKFPVRPVAARPLKSVMDSLRPHLPGSRVLDLFAGHGRFGLGALREGAERVTFVEQNRRTLGELKREAERWADRCRFYPMDVFAFLKFEAAADGPYDLVFADPPFPLWSEAFAAKLFSGLVPCLDRDAIFLVKHPSRVLPSVTVSGWIVWKDSRFGESGLTYFRRTE